MIAVATALIFSGSFAPSVEARTWTCHGTIALQGSGYSYAVPSWTMSGSATVDRENRCRAALKSNWLDNGAIWKHLGIPPAQQDGYCRSGGNFRVDYGFDRRRKDWNFTQLSKPLCKCAGPFTFQ
jgi:hypothetical protein